MGDWRSEDNMDIFDEYRDGIEAEDELNAPGRPLRTPQDSQAQQARSAEKPTPYANVRKSVNKSNRGS